MLTVIQRVTSAKVTVDNQEIAKINHGLVIFACFVAGDHEAVVEKVFNKISKLRIFADANDKMNKSIVDVNGECLIISQFTLAADITKGNRPSFTKSADPQTANQLYEYFCAQFSKNNIKTQKGIFAANMAVELTNQGPVTIQINSDDLN